MTRWGQLRQIQFLLYSCCLHSREERATCTLFSQQREQPPPYKSITILIQYLNRLYKIFQVGFVRLPLRISARLARLAFNLNVAKQTHKTVRVWSHVDLVIDSVQSLMGREPSTPFCICETSTITREERLFLIESRDGFPPDSSLRYETYKLLRTLTHCQKNV